MAKKTLKKMESKIDLLNSYIAVIQDTKDKHDKLIKALNKRYDELVNQVDKKLEKLGKEVE